VLGKCCIWVSVAVCLFTGCSRRALHEAQAVVKAADSLWHNGKMYGIDEGDSATLAQAYETLEKQSAVSRQLSEVFPFVHCTSSLCTSYVHACYHYGRLLREKDDPVAAMQVFIDATHSRTRDYHILGRVYSNMGSICHLAGEFPLSYDMFERSADCFLQGGDTLLYYYGVYNMAFEKAELVDTCRCLSLLQKIEHVPELSALSALVKAELHSKCQQYDSAIYYANISEKEGNAEPTGRLIKAYAFSQLGIQDSALKYAQIVVADTFASYQNIFNALYFISRYDSTLCTEKIREFASQREDIRYYEYEPEMEKLSQAVQLLEQDLNKKPDWRRWGIWITIVLFCLTAFGFLYFSRKRKQQMQKQLTVISSKQATNIIESIKKHLDTADINNTLHWKDYEAMKKEVNLYTGGLVSKIEEQHLNEVEIRFCILTLLDFPLNKIAKTIHYSYPSAIKTLKKRTADKLGTTPKELKNFLLHML